MTHRLLNCLVLAGLSLGWGAAAQAAATAGTARLEFTTTTTQAKYAPKHFLAVWVTDAQTNFIKTLVKQAGKRQNKLAVWTNARQGSAAVDGVTGATLSSHGARAATWNCRDASNNLVPDGNYLFFIEFTEANTRGPCLAVPFAKGPAEQNRAFAGPKNIQDVKVSFTPGGPN
jgi:hypothetical protein